jgi:hypothetical protein
VPEYQVSSCSLPQIAAGTRSPHCRIVKSVVRSRPLHFPLGLLASAVVVVGATNTSCVTRVKSVLLNLERVVPLVMAMGSVSRTSSVEALPHSAARPARSVLMILGTIATRRRGVPTAEASVTKGWVNSLCFLLT